MMQFVQASAYNYLGALSSFTAIVVVFGHRLTASGASLTAERYTLAREEEIVPAHSHSSHCPSSCLAALSFHSPSLSLPLSVCVQVIGVAIALVISGVLWPVSSIRLLRTEVMLSLESFQVGLQNTLSVYESLSEKHVKWKEGRGPKTEEVEGEEKQPQQPHVVVEMAQSNEEQKVNGAGAINATAAAQQVTAIEEEDQRHTHPHTAQCLSHLIASTHSHTLRQR